MAYVRRRGKLWQATVRIHLRRCACGSCRRSYSDPLKSNVQAWADELERTVRHGTVIDPNAGKTTVGQMWEKARKSRRLELASRRRDVSHWRNHVAPVWEHLAIGPITRPDISTWVNQMEQAKVGAATIQGALGVLRAVLSVAVDAKVIRDNPAVGVKPPRRNAHQDRVLTAGEDEALLAALDRVAPDRPDARLLVEVLRYCGLRWEEAAALRRERVLDDQLLSIGPVVERDRTIREYPKSPAGERLVPVDDDLWPLLLKRKLAVGRGGLLFPSRNGRPLDYSRWHDRTWQAALEGLPERPKVRGHAYRAAVVGAQLADPVPTPHDLRHTYGTRLAEAGVPPHEIMALMGHESLASVQRYIHAGDDRFTRARQAVQSGRASAGRPKAVTSGPPVSSAVTQLRRSSA